MRPAAAIITNGHLCDGYGKTAHGLIRGSDRYEIVAVLDSHFPDRDAGELLDGVHRGIPVYGSIAELMKSAPRKPEFAIIGIAFEGGILPDGWKPLLREVLRQGISLVAGLHVPLASQPDLAAAARQNGVRIIDIRKPKPAEELHFFSGEIFNISTPRVAVLGTDCSVGKRTTCRMTLELCRQNGIDAEMVFTGQTGWLQGYPYGFILDATLNDFVSGEMEHAILQCARERSPDLMLIEGQSALRNPAGPCGSELILSGNVRHVILQHPVFRPHFDGLEQSAGPLPTVQQEMDLIRAYGAETLAVCLNGEEGTADELRAHQERLAAELAIPVIRPLEEGLGALLPKIQGIIGRR